MLQQEFLDKLKRNEPIFTDHPRPAVPRIMGSESELLVHPLYTENPIPQHYLKNGGKIYTDCHHLEICTPECSNPVSWLAFYEAFKRIAFRKKPDAIPEQNWIFATNTDSEPQESTFGHHENYSTCSNFRAQQKLLPYFIARTIFCGAGKMRGKHFEISQRAKFMDRPFGITATTADRVLISQREPHSIDTSTHRMHIISGDDTMCQFQSFLRIGMTSLMVELLEQNALPDIHYDPTLAIHDLQSISQTTTDWRLTGINKGSPWAIDLLSTYVQAAKCEFSGRDDITDAVLYGMELTIERLATDAFGLFGYLDWPTKLYLLLSYTPADGTDPSDSELQSQDLQYHSLDPESSTYAGLVEACLAKQIVSDSLITHCIEYPPPDTRAHIRGTAIRLTSNSSIAFGHGNDWGMIELICTNNDSGGEQVIQYPIGKPYYTYPRIRKKIRRLIRRNTPAA